MAGDILIHTEKCANFTTVGSIVNGEQVTTEAIGALSRDELCRGLASTALPEFMGEDL